VKASWFTLNETGGLLHKKLARHMNTTSSKFFLTFIIAFLISTPCLAEKHEVKIGVLTPLSGPRADAGEFQQNGALLALEHLVENNEESSHSLKLIYDDTRYEPRAALTAYQSQRTLHNISYFIGPYGSSEVMAVAPVSERDGALLLLPGAQSDEISTAGTRIFRFIHNASQEAPFFARFIADRIGNEELCIAAASTAFTAPYIQRFKTEFTSAEKRVARVEEFEVHLTDFRSMLLRLKSLCDSHILILGTPLNTAHILRQASDINFKPKWYGLGVEGPELFELPNEISRGLLYPYSFDSESYLPAVSKFKEAYISRFGSKPDAVAANTYDSLILLNACLSKVGDKPDRVAECLYATHDYQGVSGAFSIDQNGNAVRELFIKKIQGGKGERLNRY